MKAILDQLSNTENEITNEKLMNCDKKTKTLILRAHLTHLLIKNFSNFFFYIIS